MKWFYLLSVCSLFLLTGFVKTTEIEIGSASDNGVSAARSAESAIDPTLYSPMLSGRFYESGISLAPESMIGLRAEFPYGKVKNFVWYSDNSSIGPSIWGSELAILFFTQCGIVNVTCRALLEDGQMSQPATTQFYVSPSGTYVSYID